MTSIKNTCTVKDSFFLDSFATRTLNDDYLLIPKLPML
jgi:hypothetical protein